MFTMAIGVPRLKNTDTRVCSGLGGADVSEVEESAVILVERGQN